MVDYNRVPRTELQYSEERIDREKALQWLAQERTQRKVNDRHVRKLTEDMASGRWMNFTGTNTFSFSKDGVLLDGQHRLQALLRVCRINPGFNIRASILRGVSTEAQSIMDAGKPRTISDVMGIEGYEDHRVAIASIVRLLVLRQPDGAIATDLHRRPVSGPASTALLKKYPGIVESAVMGKRVYSATNKLISTSHTGFLHCLFAEVDRFKATNFWERFMSNGFPGLELKLMELNEERGRRSFRPDVLAACIKAWNAYRKGEREPEDYTWKEGVEPLPRIEGLPIERED